MFLDWWGVYYLVLVILDMDVIVWFYVGVFGMLLVVILWVGLMCYYFFEFGLGNIIVFFEILDVEMFFKLVGVFMLCVIQFDYVLFVVDDEVVFVVFQ